LWVQRNRDGRIRHSLIPSQFYGKTTQLAMPARMPQLLSPPQHCDEAIWSAAARCRFS
jgi:hypothetical protein